MAALRIKGNLRSWGAGTAKVIVVPGVVAQSCGLEAQEYTMLVEDCRKAWNEVTIHIVVDMRRPEKLTEKPTSERSEE